MGVIGKHHEYNHGILSGSVTYEQIRGINLNNTAWGFNYYEWSAIHKACIVTFSLLMVYHIYIHWNWYKEIIRRHLIHKNKEVFTLSAIFLIAALTGFASWLVSLVSNSVTLRYTIIEIHDKITLALIIYFILHVIRRKKWFAASYRKIKI